MTDPIDLSIYRNRAANKAKPIGFTDNFRVVHTLDDIEELAATGAQFCYETDTSEFQPLYNNSYPYRTAIARSDSGGRTDNNYLGNFSWALGALNSNRLDVWTFYVVFMPGQSSAIMTRTKNIMGSQCPHPHMCPMIDMESGNGFAGPGNHSSEANELYNELAAWCGNPAKVQGYANFWDWGSNWPTRPATMRRRIAAYNPGPDPSPWAWQFAGGLGTQQPVGSPTAVAPFGSYVDINRYPGTVAQYMTDLGIGTTPAPPTSKDTDVNIIFQKNGGIFHTNLGQFRHITTSTGVKDLSDTIIGNNGGDGQVHPTGRSWEAYGIYMGLGTGGIPVKVARLEDHPNFPQEFLAKRTYSVGQEVNGFIVESIDDNGEPRYAGVDYGAYA